jgi:hypothetical protein
VCAAFPRKKKQGNWTIKEKKGPVYKLAWGSPFAKGLTMGKGSKGITPHDLTTARRLAIVRSMNAMILD